VSQIDFKDQQGLKALVSDEFSDWSEPVTVTQQMINAFAELSGDHFWLHVDVDRCATESPFKSTIAHGFLILSMISRMPCGVNVVEQVSGYSHMLNYGSDKLRFLNAVPVDSDIHARCRVADVAVSENKTKVTTEIHVHVVGQDRPALLVELAFVFM
jgi:acyl dehydratase